MGAPRPMTELLRGRTGALAACIAALLVILGQIAAHKPDRLQPDEHTYLDIINDVVRTGVFTDGTMSRDGIAGKPGRFIAPAFPLMVAAVARLDGGFARTLACHAKNEKALRNACGSLWPLYVLNGLIAAFGLLGLFLIARWLTGSEPVAWASLGVALASGEPAGYARLLLTDTLAFSSFVLALTGLVALTLSGKRLPAAACGAALGLAALTRPSFIYILYLVVAGLLLLALQRRRHATPVAWAHAPIVLAVAFAIMAPWMLRNLILFGDGALTAGYGGFTLVQRVSYNAMSWGEWAAAWIFWFPDIGDDLARALLPAGLTTRLGWNDPTSFYKIGLGTLRTATEAAAGGPQNHVAYLLHHHVLGDPVKHVAVTLVLAWRGLWVGKWLAVAGLLLLWPAARAIIRRGHVVPLIALLLPLAGIVGLHAFVSVSIARYNLPLLVPYAIAIAMALIWALDGLWLRLSARRS